MTETRKFWPLFAALIISAVTSVALADPGQSTTSAQSNPISIETTQPSTTSSGDADPVFATIIAGRSPREVGLEILAENPNAKVFVAEDDGTADSGQGLDVAPNAPNGNPIANANINPNPNQNANAKPRGIQTQGANDLNTVLIGSSYTYEDIYFLVSPHFSWLQRLALVGFNAAYMNQFDLKLGRWSQILQKGGKKFSDVFVNKGIIQEKSRKKAELVGNFLTHGGLTYIVYGLLQITSDLPHLQEGFLSLGGQENILRKAGSGFLSGFGWTMLARKWDALPENERPISRQAYSTFNTIRGAAIGIFMPLLITSSNSMSLEDFVKRNLPFFISAAGGTVAYFFGDKILRRYPQVGQGLEKFDGITRRLNEKIAQGRLGTVVKKFGQANARVDDAITDGRERIARAVRDARSKICLIKFTLI